MKSRSKQSAAKKAPREKAPRGLPLSNPERIARGQARMTKARKRTKNDPPPAPPPLPLPAAQPPPAAKVAPKARSIWDDEEDEISLPDPLPPPAPKKGEPLIAPAGFFDLETLGGSRVLLVDLASSTDTSDLFAYSYELGRTALLKRADLTPRADVDAAVLFLQRLRNRK